MNRVKPRWWQACWKCSGRGYVTVAGDRYTREELRTRPELAATYADILVNGGWAAPAIKRVCPSCSGLRLNKRGRKKFLP